MLGKFPNGRTSWAFLGSKVYLVIQMNRAKGFGLVLATAAVSVVATLSISQAVAQSRADDALLGASTGQITIGESIMSANGSHVFILDNNVLYKIRASDLAIEDASDLRQPRFAAPRQDANSMPGQEGAGTGQ